MSIIAESRIFLKRMDKLSILLHYTFMVIRTWKQAGDNVYKTQKIDIRPISGHQVLLRERPDQLCVNLTSVKTDVEEL